MITNSIFKDVQLVNNDIVFTLKHGDIMVKQFQGLSDKIKSLDIDKILEVTSLVNMIIGYSGLGLAVLVPPVSLVFFVFFGIKIDKDLFWMLMAVALWMSTFLLPPTAKIGTVIVTSKLYRWSTRNQYQVTNWIRESKTKRDYWHDLQMKQWNRIGKKPEGFFKDENERKIKLVNLRVKFGWIVFYTITAVIPIAASIISSIIGSDRNIIALIPIIIYSVLVILSISGRKRDLGDKVCIIACIISALLLWLIPAFHPFRLITQYILTGEVVLASILNPPNS